MEQLALSRDLCAFLELFGLLIGYVGELDSVRGIGVGVYLGPRRNGAQVPLGKAWF